MPRPFENRGAGALRRQAAAFRNQAVQAGRRAKRQLLLLLPVLAALVVAYVYRVELFGIDEPARIVLAVAMVVIGWAVARNLGRALQPRLARRLDPGSAGVAGFLIRLVALLAIVIVSLRLAGLKPGTLALGASFTAVIVGLAAQQTVGNMIAGVVLLSARPFKIGELVRFTGGGMDVEGTVAAHGLLYLTLTDGDDLVQIPNSAVLSMSSRPLREPAAVDMRARFPGQVDPVEVQNHVAEAITVPVKGAPDVELEEFDGEEVSLRIRAVPADDDHGGRLSREVLEAVASLRRLSRANGSGGSATPRTTS